MNAKTRTTQLIVVMSLIGIMILSACQPAQSAPVDNTAAIQAAAETMVAQTEQAKICDLSYAGFNFNQEAGTTKTWTKADGTSFTVVLEASTCNILKLQDPANDQPASTPTAMSASSADTSAYEGTDACRDGYILPNVLQNVTDVPWGHRDGAVVSEIAWKPGTGFAGWFRLIAIAERVTGTRMPYANDVLTVHAVQYCGSLQAIKDWAPTHVDAMINSSQNSAGQRPFADEIPIVLLKNDGTIEIVKAAPNGPSLDEIKAHLEMRP